MNLDQIYESLEKQIDNDVLKQRNAGKKVAKKKLTDSNIRVTTTSNDALPTQVLLGRVKAVKVAVTEKPNFSDLRKRERESEQEERIWAELASFDRSQKRGGEESEPNLWRTEATDKTEAPSPRGLHELQMVNHNLRPRVYFLPS